MLPDDTGQALQIRASDIFVEDAILCWAHPRGDRVCIRPIDGDLVCPDHGERRLP